MSILIDKNTKVICQGITGGAGSFHTRSCRDYGTQIVAGVTPGKGGTNFENIPIYNTVAEAKQKTGADATMIFVPAPFTKDAILEAFAAGIRVVIAITEGMPVKDMAVVRDELDRINAQKRRVWLVGPNCPGVIVPGQIKIGIMPGPIHLAESRNPAWGKVGIVSRSGTLTYEAVWQLTELGIAQSTVVGIGGDPIAGTGFIEVLEAFEADAETKAILLMGEIGGNQEEAAARYFKEKMSKPMIGFIAGKTAPPGKRMGHAGAIVEGKSGGTADSKIQVMRNFGVHVADSPATIGKTVLKSLETIR